MHSSGWGRRDGESPTLSCSNDILLQVRDAQMSGGLRPPAVEEFAVADGSGEAEEHQQQTEMRERG